MLRIIFMSLLLICQSPQAMATSCPSREYTLKEYSAVFKGTAGAPVDAMEMATPAEKAEYMEKAGKMTKEELEEFYARNGRTMMRTFRFVKSYKGEDRKTFDIFYQSGGDQWPFPSQEFKTGKTYIIYAKKDETRYWANDPCNPSQLVKDIDENDTRFSQLMVFDAQQEALKRLIKENPDNWYYYHQLGLLYESNNDYIRAADTYIKGRDAKDGHLGFFPVIVTHKNDTRDPAWQSKTSIWLFFTGQYAKMLMLQGKDLEAVEPASFYYDTETRARYDALMTKLKK